MSIFTDNQASKSRAELIADEICIAPLKMATRLVQEWEMKFDELWLERNGVPVADKIKAIGDRGEEVIKASAAFVQFIAGLLAGKNDALIGRIMTRINKIPPFEIKDGHIVLTEKKE